jgi:hypothetical protein
LRNVSIVELIDSKLTEIIVLLCSYDRGVPDDLGLISIKRECRQALAWVMRRRKWFIPEILLFNPTLYRQAAAAN